ncbi:3-isopropylmalate dehydratase large subunit [Pseudohalocynthiibacter sp. F2068]|jgi:3-isopropylmalate/(R)-2-methylmalate dehydratase large subunit|uniref:3-isopropylmalate dehydratase large subunit n=1 Tax=Pseudohalocynthiibacter sp. F2068 TaxID=2926418 RepID=UPI001FF198D0|nr:3-isopropylmalate dehydratase large subunit [Pseudohalocynthiibacter sp. F2068]MCK0100712.1 3-isopropylmalate dehydratase large subunit [Pseudohalocynthiibacter sp. F2068]
MQQTLAQKIISRAAGRDHVIPGEVVTAKVDLAMIHDSGGPRRVAPILKDLGVGLWDKEKVFLVSDHFVPGDTEEGASILALTRDWARSTGVRFHDGQGICHVVLPESGQLQPGMFAVGGDSHSPTGGAMGAFMFGIGATEMAGVLATGEIWVKVPETIRIEWTGRLGDGLMAKDIMLALCGRLGMDGGKYQAVEYTGDAIKVLSMQERMTLANMAAELGGQTGLVAPDEVTAAFLRSVGGEVPDLGDLHTDPDALVLEHHSFDATSLTPQVAAPHSPANAMPALEAEKTAIGVAYVGACTGAKYEDLQAAARILKGRKLAAGVELLVAPSSKRDQDRATKDGIMAVFEAVGAKILPNACGICAGYGTHRLGADVTCISSTARNFKGRMGEASSQVWLGSPLTVAAAAVAGHIVDPREMLA